LVLYKEFHYLCVGSTAIHTYAVIMEDTFSDCYTLHSKDHNRRQ